MKRMGMLVCVAMLSGCDGGVSEKIATLSGSADERRQAMIELTMTDLKEQPQIIAAAKDSARPVAQRIDLVTVLFRMLLNRGDNEIRAAFAEMLKDPEPRVRIAVVKALGDVQQKPSMPLVLTAMKDADPGVQLEALNSFTKLVKFVEQDDAEKSLEAATKIVETKPTGELLVKAMDVLESGAEKTASKADQLVLGGQTAEAEKLLTETLKRVPDSRNISYKLGRFYFDNEQREKGLSQLEQSGFLLRIKKLAAVPLIDGDFSDECWKNAAAITRFYKCVNSFVATPAAGKGEIRIGYSDDSLFIAYKVFEPSTKGIARAVKQHDGDVWKDDCTEIFIDATHGYKAFDQIIVNALGTVQDLRYGPKNASDKNWMSKAEVKTKVDETSWQAEIRLPFSALSESPVKTGTIWGFNITTTRIGNTSEMGQWVPTYGYSLRPERFGFLVFE